MLHSIDLHSLPLPFLSCCVFLPLLFESITLCIVLTLSYYLCLYYCVSYPLYLNAGPRFKSFSLYLAFFLLRCPSNSSHFKWLLSFCVFIPLFSVSHIICISTLYVKSFSLYLSPLVLCLSSFTLCISYPLYLNAGPRFKSFSLYLAYIFAPVLLSASQPLYLPPH